MLLNFKMKNFKSFYNTTEINMIADNMKREYPDRLINIRKKEPNKELNKRNVLPSMVIYGANANGKTSIIAALDSIKEIVTNGTIKKQINNATIDKLEISSFIHDVKKMKEPIEFNITFKTNLNIYNYIIKIKIMNPLIGKERSIVCEELNVIEYQDIGTSIKENKINIFKRNENEIILNNNKKVLKIYEKEEQYLSELNNLQKSINENLDEETLFLTTLFKGIISQKVANDILDWFQHKLITIVDFDLREPYMSFDGAPDNSIWTNESLDRLLKLADFGPQNIGYTKNPEGKFVLASMYEPKGAKKGIMLESELIESRGTTKLVDFWVGFMELFEKGGIFVIDEFDCSIHPELIGGIIDLFNNKKINKAHAQLIFNTHNPLYLQRRFFRRDQILFVEKDEETYISNVYKLSEFDVETENNYMKKYFEGEFGALPYIDFESILDMKEDG